MLRTRLTKAGVVMAAVASIATGMFAGPASAGTQRPAQGTENLNLAGIGSDTIYCVDNATSAAYNSAVASTTGDTIYNVPPIGGVNLGCETTPTTYEVPADSIHGDLYFANPPVPPTSNAPPGDGQSCANPMPANSASDPWEFPDGSSLGITCYTDDAGAGNFAYTRSSRGYSSSKDDPTNLQFWAFALDAVTWSTNAGTHAPASLTLSQISAILNCQDTTWGQVNGHPSDTTPISVWYPQDGSGTGQFFAQIFNGNTYPSPSSCIPSSHFVEENDGDAVTAKDAFYPYSFALHTAQTNGTEANITNGFVLKQVSGTLPKLATITEAAAKTNITSDACTSPVAKQFCATRYVYHTIWTEVPAAEVSGSIAYMGVPSTGTAASTSYCSNAYSSTISEYGFKPLTLNKTSSVTGGVKGKSYCREVNV